MSIDRVKIAISGGGAVGNAFMNMYFASATASNLAAIRTFLEAIKAYLPTTTTYTVPGSGDTIDETTGKLTGGWTATPPAPSTGTSVSIPSIATGILVEWKTGTVVDGHRPVGKTILVPAGNAAYVSTGVISGTVVSAINTAGVTFLSSTAGFVVWHRPKYDRTKTPPVLIRPGSTVLPTVVNTWSKPTVLRSRRD